MRCWTGWLLLMAAAPAFAGGPQSEVLKKLAASQPDAAAFSAWIKENPLPVVTGAWPGAAQIEIAAWFAPSEADSVRVHSLDLNRDFPLEKWPGQNIWSAVITVEKPEDFEYQLAYTKDGKTFFKADPANPFIKYSKVYINQIRRPCSPQPALLSYKLKTANPYFTFPAREFLVSLPEGYFAQPERRYAVVYQQTASTCPTVLVRPRAAGSLIPRPEPWPAAATSNHSSWSACSIPRTATTK